MFWAACTYVHIFQHNVKNLLLTNRGTILISKKKIIKIVSSVKMFHNLSA
jgi:hypothetical protein